MAPFLDSPSTGVNRSSIRWTSTPFPDGANSLSLVTSFEYLRVQVTPDSSSYLVENLLLLFKRIQTKCNAWCKLPFLVIGRIHLIKMVWCPQLLYILHNSTQWIPHRGFIRIEMLFRFLFWNKQVARIRLSMLQYGNYHGGLAVPNARLYFYASQLQHLGGWRITYQHRNVTRIFHSICSTTTSLLGICQFSVSIIVKGFCVPVFQD